MAVRLALVVEAGHGLLADVAALGEADRALVDPGLLGHRLRRHLRAEARPAGLDAEDLGGLDGCLGHARAGERLAHGAGVGVGHDQVEARVGGDRARHGAADRDHPVRVLGAAGRRRPPPRRAGPVTERIDQGPLTSSISTSRPILYIPRWRAIAGRATASVSSQKPSSSRRSSAQVALHLPLAVEQRGVAALAGLERLDVVGELALEVLGGLGAAELELAPVGAIEETRLLAQQPVLAVQLDRRRQRWAGSYEECIFRRV